MVEWGSLMQGWIVSYPWLGNQYVQLILWLVLTFIVAKLFKDVCLAIIKKLTLKTESDIDDVLLELSARPLFYLVVTIGLYFGLKPLHFFTARPALLGHIFFVIGTLIVSWMIARVIAFLVTRWFRKHKGTTGTPRLINLIISIVIYIGAIIVVLSYFNIEFTPFIAALGVGGLAVGLALQDTLSNVFAGVHIISDEPIRIGDIVEIPSDNITGVVKDIGWRSTRIETFADNIIIVPNSRIANSILLNTSMPTQAVKTIVLCGVDYGSNLKEVERISLEVAKDMQKTVEGAVKEFDPIFRYDNFGDNNINFKVILAAKSRGDKFLLSHEFMKALHARFAREGIDISWPIRKIYNIPYQKPKKETKALKPAQKKIRKASSREDTEF